MSPGCSLRCVQGPSRPVLRDVDPTTSQTSALGSVGKGESDQGADAEEPSDAGERDSLASGRAGS